MSRVHKIDAETLWRRLDQEEDRYHLEYKQYMDHCKHEYLRGQYDLARDLKFWLLDQGYWPLPVKKESKKENEREA
jgi:hypothetical protein